MKKKFLPIIICIIVSLSWLCLCLDRELIMHTLALIALVLIGYMEFRKNTDKEKEDEL